jgi:hypothetical protein
MDLYTIVTIGGVTLGMLILDVSAWALLSAWRHDDVQDNGEAVSGWGTPGETTSDDQGIVRWQEPDAPNTWPECNRHEGRRRLRWHGRRTHPSLHTERRRIANRAAWRRHSAPAS